MRQQALVRTKTRKTISFLTLGAVLFAVCVSVEAQQSKKVPRIGFLAILAIVSPSTISDRVEAFRRGLHELGYVEGKSVVIEWRFDEGKPVPRERARQS
jgi:putative ABC transport system substrate-binding protein